MEDNNLKASKRRNCWKKNERRKNHKDVLEAVLEVLENEESIETIWKQFGDKKKESKEEYISNRKQRILKMLEMAKVCKDVHSYHFCGNIVRMFIVLNSDFIINNFPEHNF